MSFVTLLIAVVINSNSEEDYVKSSEYLVQFSPEWPPVFLQGSPGYKGCVGKAHMAFGCFLMWRLQLPRGSLEESMLDVSDLVVTPSSPPFLAGLLFMLITRRSPAESK